MKKFIVILVAFLLVLLPFFVFFWWGGPGRTEKLYHIARDPTWYPLNFLGNERNVSAFSDDLVYAVGQEEKKQVIVITIPANLQFRALEIGNADGILTAELPPAEEARQYLISEPYMLTGPVLIVREDSTEKGLHHMAGKIVGVRRGSSLSYEIKNYPSMVLVPYDNPLEALESLQNNKFDGVILDAVPAYVYTRTFYKGMLHVVTAPMTNEGLRLVALKGRGMESFMDDFNRDVKKMKEDGRYDELIQKWSLFRAGQNQSVL